MEAIIAAMNEFDEDMNQDTFDTVIVAVQEHFGDKAEDCLRLMQTVGADFYSYLNHR